MKLWLDAHLSPAIVPWLQNTFKLEVTAVQNESELIVAQDQKIFQQAKDAHAVVMTKDRDFVDLVERFGPPPHILWLTCGNTSNAALKRILSTTLTEALELVRDDIALIEISASHQLEPIT